MSDLSRLGPRPLRRVVVVDGVGVPEGEGPLYGGPVYPGNGYPPRPGEDRPMGSAWGRLSKGGAMGKKANIVFNGGDGGSPLQSALVPILQVDGDDADACQLVVTLGPPSVVPLEFSSTLGPSNPQNATGEQDNLEMQGRTFFPGTLDPITWPPFEALIEWGVGGNSSEVAVDFINGATVPIVASWVRVHGVVVSGTEAGVSGTSAIYTLSAFVGPGLARARAQKTVYAGQVDSLVESDVFAVPKFAKRAYVVGCDDSAAPDVAVTVATLRFWQSPNKTANVGNFVSSGNQPGSFPVPAGAAYFTVVNGMSVSPLLSVVFELGL